MAGPQYYSNQAVVASPTAAAETVICTLKGVSAAFAGDVWTLTGWADASIAAAGTVVILQIRRDSVTGHSCGSSTYTFKAAGDVARMEVTITCSDAPGPINGATYELTMQVTLGATTSTVHAVSLSAQS